MTPLPRSIGPSENGSEPRLASDRDGFAADQPLFRFGLRQLLFFVACVCGLLAAMGLSSGVHAVLILLAAVIVVMHVFATALGTRLQERTHRQRLLQRANLAAAESADGLNSQRSNDLEAIRAAPRSPWHGRGCTYLPWLPRIVVGSMTAGALVGVVLLNGIIGHRTSTEGIVVGAASFAVLGGWISFLAVSFYGVFSHGFREALAEQMKDQVGQPTNR